jgi:hypothetical protein
MSDLNRLRDILDREDFEYEIRVEDGDPVVVVALEQTFRPLPEELQPFERAPYDIERAMWKGYGQTKQTFEGVNFEFALQDYATDLFYRDPRVPALEETLEGVFEIDALNAYEARRQALWDEIVNTRDDIRRFEKILEEDYL